MGISLSQYQTEATAMMEEFHPRKNECKHKPDVIRQSESQQFGTLAYSFISNISEVRQLEEDDITRLGTVSVVHRV